MRVVCFCAYAASHTILMVPEFRFVNVNSLITLCMCRSNDRCRGCEMSSAQLFAPMSQEEEVGSLLSVPHNNPGTFALMESGNSCGFS